MRKDTLMSRLAAPLAMSAMLAAPIVGAADKEQHFWSAQPEGTAWVTGYGECWQSAGGPTNLSPCVKGSAAVAPVAKEFTVRLNFEFDKYRIDNVVNDGELRRLDDYIAQAKGSDVNEQITLVGHTDAKGSDAYNMQLGMRRAEAVRDYMVSRGVPASDIVSVKSMGKRDLLPSYDPYSVQQRRVVILAEYEGN